MPAKTMNAKTKPSSQPSPAPAPPSCVGPNIEHPDGAATQDCAYDVGYGKPPVATRFPKGESGNPAGRPPGTGRAVLSSARALVLDEAYRTVSVKDGKQVLALPALQAAVRSQLALAAKGNGPAQRAIIAMVEAIEDRCAVAEAQAAAADAEAAARKPQSTIDAARRIVFLLRLASEEMKKQPPAADGQPLTPEDQYIKDFYKND